MLTRPLPRLPYFSLGVVLFALKSSIDYAVSRAFGRTYSVLFYVNPLDAPLFQVSEHPGYWLALWGVALPFIAIGCVLTFRRLRDAALSPWYVLLFFVPFANLLFFAVASVVPSRQGAADQRLPEQAPYRQGKPMIARLAPEGRSFASCVFLAGALGAVIGLGALGISVGLLRSYGGGLMLGAPVISGFATSMFFVQLSPSSRFSGAALATIVSFLVSFGATIAFALEGLGCLVMVLPLVVPITFFGSFLGYAIAKSLGSAPGRAVSAPLVVLPLVFGAERVSPLPEAPSEAVVSEIVIDAPPDVVWRHVVSFPPLDPPEEFMFRHGIAAPMSATIEGEGPGAIRRCNFTTGTFVEPIEVWSPGRELTFSVTAQPDPMVEQTLWNGVRPPHLDGYLATTRGQFLLEPLPDGRTRLVGSTWYRTGMQPEVYWRLWGDAIIHRIHMRVLRHVAKLAEEDHRAR